MFLDVTKAYDKAWLNAILYTAHKHGLKGKNWRIMKELNNNLTATVRTEVGNTRTIKIRDSIRQGGVLSVIEYANLIDEIAKELKERTVGNQKLWSNNISGCLLWMDDVALIHHDKDELQKMLDITDDIAKRYHIKFGKEKSQILTIGKNESTPQGGAEIGDLTLDNTATYKYLGMIVNNKGSLQDHLTKTKGKVEAALQTIFSLAGNAEFYNIEMATIWRLFHSCIIPILTYGAETWIPTKAEQKYAQNILNNTIKRILMTPTSTPSEILIAETGIWDIETQMAKKQITYYHKIKTTHDEKSTIAKTISDRLNPWNKQLNKTMTKMEINHEELMSKTKYQAKKYIIKKLKAYQIKKIYIAAENKSKVRDYVCNKTRESIAATPRYMNKLNRMACTNIFNTRARMLKVKRNYRNQYTDMTCRWCHQQEESQVHILTECAEFKEITKNTQYELYYKEDKISTKAASEILNRVIHQINLMNQSEAQTNNPNKILKPRQNQK